MAKLRQLTLRRLATFAVDIAAEHVDDDGIADLDAEPVGHLLLHRDERRAGIVGRPPSAGDDLGAFRRLRGEGHAAIALQRPGDLVARLDL